jgi:O-antigen/teichoic acid export membrane protein
MSATPLPNPPPQGGRENINNPPSQGGRENINNPPPKDGSESISTARRVARNSISPLLAQLLTKAIDTVYGLVVLRLISDKLNGDYAFAVSIWLYASTITNWGLDVLLIRDVARDKAQANRYFSNTLLLRLGLSLLATVLLVLLLVPNPTLLLGTHLENAGYAIVATLLLAVSLLPGALAAACTAVFQAHERMTVPAVVTIITATVKFAIGLGALGLVWLANSYQPSPVMLIVLSATPVVINCVTAGILFVWMRRALLRPHLEFERRFAFGLLIIALPLLLNSLLQNLFFKVDYQILRAEYPSAVLGRYDAAYKFINFFPLITANLTFAIFPLLSRYAADTRDGLLRAYTITLKLLLLIAMPAVAATLLLSGPIIWLFAGDKYLPDAAAALQILILFLPFSFFNGLTQYVLIALDRQRLITVAFVLVATFNIVANLILIPMFNLYAASWVTVASELVLMVPLYLWTRRELGTMPNLFALAWRPTLAAAIGAAGIWATLALGLPALLAAAVMALLYVALLFALRTFSNAELALARQVVRRK